MKSAILSVLLVTTLVACGGDEDGTKKLTESVESAAEEWPKCVDVWVVGKTLPEDYEGCINEAGEIVPTGAEWDCDDGTVLTYVDEPPAFARIGGEIKEGNNQSDAFSAELDKCEPL